MIAMTRRSWLAAVGLAPLAATAAENPKSQQRTFQNIPPRELLRLRHFPNSELVTHQGKKVRFYDDLIKGRKVVINFMYAKCEGICVPVTANLVKVQKILKGRVGRDIFMYSITLKPEEDTPEVLNKYARTFHVGPGWLFLTGKPGDIEVLRRKLGFVYADPIEDADKSNHIGMLRFGNELFARWAACPGQAHADWIAISILSEVDGPTRTAAKQTTRNGSLAAKENGK